jgi:hypothetical protein
MADDPDQGLGKAFESAPDRASKIVAKITETSKPVGTLSRGELAGCLGAMSGIGLALLACAIVPTIYAPILLAYGAGAGLFLGVRLSRNDVGGRNDEAADVLKLANAHRQDELKLLLENLVEARAANATDTVKLLEDKRVELVALPPQQLIERYGLSSPQLNARSKQLLRLSPPT